MTEQEYEKILLRLSGYYEDDVSDDEKGEPDFVPSKGPILLVNQGLFDMMSWFSLYPKTNGVTRY